jgi:hypothetical protein
MENLRRNLLCPGGGGRLRKQTYLADKGRESYKKDKIYSFSLDCTTIFERFANS